MKKILTGDMIKYIAVFTGVLITRMISMFLLDGGMHLIADEMGFMNMPATLAGRDWSGIGSYIKYYGYGYSVLFTPFFLLCKNPYTLYWLIMITGQILISISSLFIYRIWNILTENHKKNLGIFVSIIVSWISLTDIRYINNEPMIQIVCWGFVLICCLILKNDNEHKSTLALSVSLVFVMLYALTVHNRLYVLFFVLAFMILIYKLIRHKWVISPGILGILLLGAGLVTSLNSHITNLFIALEDSGEILNTASDTVGRISNTILSFGDKETFIDYLDAIIKILLGNVFTANFFTGGLFVVSLFMVIGIIKKYYPSICKKNKEKLTYRDAIADTVLMIGFAGFVITIVGLSFLWAQGTARGLAYGYEYNTPATKVLSYIRYYSTYLSILILGVIAKTANGTLFKFNRKKSRLFLVLFIIIVDLWSIAVAPYWWNSSNGITVFGCYGGYTLKDTVTNPSLYVWITIMSLLMILFVYVIGGGLNRKSIYLMLAFSFGLIFFRSCYNARYLNITYGKRGDAGYIYVNELIESGETEEKQEIYMCSLRTTEIAYQYMLDVKIKILGDEIPTNIEDMILITNSPGVLIDAQRNDFYYMQMDEDECICLKGDKWITKARQLGWDLQEVEFEDTLQQE